MRRLRKIRSWGVVLLGIWLVLSGGLSLLHISFPAESEILDLLAIAAGVLILIER